MVADPSIKIGSPIVVHASRPDVIQYAGGALHYICEAVNPWLDRPLAERGAAPLDIGAAPTCALLLDRAAAIDIGLFDERYFIGKEDGDFTHRVKMAGYKIWELPQSLVLHNSRPRGAWLFYYQIRNRWHFILKNYQCADDRLPDSAADRARAAAVRWCSSRRATAGPTCRAVGGLMAMLPALPRDRALARRIRRKSRSRSAGQRADRRARRSGGERRWSETARRSTSDSWTRYWALLRKTRAGAMKPIASSRPDSDVLSSRCSAASRRTRGSSSRTCIGAGFGVEVVTKRSAPRIDAANGRSTMCRCIASDRPANAAPAANGMAHCRRSR